jgi:hypothetical protein
MLGDVIYPAGEARIRVVRLQISFFVAFVDLCGEMNCFF